MRLPCPDGFGGIQLASPHCSSSYGEFHRRDLGCHLSQHQEPLASAAAASLAPPLEKLVHGIVHPLGFLVGGGLIGRGAGGGDKEPAPMAMVPVPRRGLRGRRSIGSRRGAAVGAGGRAASAGVDDSHNDS